LSDRPALSTATRWKYMECASGFGVSMHLRALSCAAAKTAYNIVAVRRPRTTLMPSLPAVRSIVFRSASTRMDAPSRPARSQAGISLNGLYGAALRWIGLNTQRADIAKLSARLSVPARDSGREATSSRGSIVHAFGQVESRPPARMTQMPILDTISTEMPIHNVCWPITPFGQVALARFGRLTLPIIPNHLTARWE